MAFYTFSLKDIEGQTNTNWCWCACLLWIIERYNINTPYNEQWKLLYYYLFNVSDKHDVIPYKKNEIENDSIYNYNINMPEDVLTLFESLTEEAFSFEQMDITGKSFNQLKEKFNYNRIKKEFEINKAPYVLWIDSHIILITGVGTIKGCDYLLISDPANGGSEYYILIENYINQNKNDFRFIWKLKNPNGLELIEDNEIDHLLAIYFDILIENRIHERNLPLFNSASSVINISHQFDHLFLSHENNNPNELKESLRSFIKNYSFTGNCTRERIIKDKDKIKSDLKNTIQIIKSYIESDEKDIDLNMISLYNDATKSDSRIVDENDILKVLIDGKSIDYVKAVERLNIK